MRNKRLERLAGLTKGAALLGLGVIHGACGGAPPAPAVVNAPVADPAAMPPTASLDAGAPVTVGTAGAPDATVPNGSTLGATTPVIVNSPPGWFADGGVATRDASAGGATTDAGHRFPILNAPRHWDAGARPIINAPPFKGQSTP